MKKEDIKQWFNDQKAKAINFTDKVKVKAKESYEWVKDHPVESAALATAAVKVTKMVSNTIDEARDKHWQETHYYDNGLQQYIELKRPLTQREKKWVQDAHAEGRGTYYEIYRSRDLIK